MDGAGYEFRGAMSEDDLRGILSLQAANTPAAISADELRSEGFVTLRHDLPTLRRICGSFAHIIATPAGRDEIAGYALVMQPEHREVFPTLGPMFARLDSVPALRTLLERRRWYFMGQICVGKAHRGRGLVEGMYGAHRRLMGGAFDLVVTLIDRANPRSVRVHERAGFRIVDEYRSDDGRAWVIVAMDLATAGVAGM
ncbi:MAG: GNAT family N-acetyltransferase [Phycisphaerales bacterium]